MFPEHKNRRCIDNDPNKEGNYPGLEVIFPLSKDNHTRLEWNV